MCFICKSTFERFILLREVLNYVQTDDARTGVCSPYKLVSHTSVVCLWQVISSRVEVEVSSLYTLCKKKNNKNNSVFVSLHVAACPLSPAMCSVASTREGSRWARVRSRWTAEPVSLLLRSADPVVLGKFQEARSVALMTLLPVKLSPN